MSLAALWIVDSIIIFGGISSCCFHLIYVKRELDVCISPLTIELVLAYVTSLFLVAFSMVMNMRVQQQQQQQQQAVQSRFRVCCAIGWVLLSTYCLASLVHVFALLLLYDCAPKPLAIWQMVFIVVCFVRTGFFITFVVIPFLFSFCDRHPPPAPPPRPPLAAAVPQPQQQNIVLLREQILAAYHAAGLNQAELDMIPIVMLQDAPIPAAWHKDVCIQIDAPISRASAAKRPSTALGDSSMASAGVRCAICFETMMMDAMVKQLPCRHVFNVSCLEGWLMYKNACPLCREPAIVRPELDLSALQVDP